MQIVVGRAGGDVARDRHVLAVILAERKGVRHVGEDVVGELVGALAVDGAGLGVGDGGPVLGRAEGAGFGGGCRAGSAATARTVYGKSTYELTDNIFINVTYPFSIEEYDGKDITITGNTATGSSGNSLYPYLYFSSYYFAYAVDVSGDRILRKLG